jgi:hypothetical protein
VKIIRNLEEFLKKNIEEFFNKNFSSSLQPVEIAKNLVYKMENDKSIGVSKIYVPNHYLIYVNEKDYARMNPYCESITKDISEYLIKIANEKNYSIIGKPIEEIKAADNVIQGNFRSVAAFTEPIPLENELHHVTENSSDTLIFSKISHEINSKKVLYATLYVIEGVDKGLQLSISGSRVNIGRRETNEFPLADMNTSRLHAYIVLDEDCHLLYDAKSLNGTYVNGHRITRKHLKTGDHIKVGHTTILYEVK